jgi:hypothetical protein
MAVGSATPDYHHSCAFHAPLDNTMELSLAAAKPNRAWIDVSDKQIVKHLAKRLGKTQKEVFAAIDKVGSNAETVIKELRAETNAQRTRSID